MTKHTILFLAANPLGTDRLALDREAHAIQAELERSGHRDQFELVTRWAAQPLDLLRELRKLRPSVVHFALAVICDRDYRCDAEIAEVSHELMQHVSLVHFHLRKEIENYLLVPAALQRAAQQYLHEGGKPKTIPNIETTLTEIAEELKTLTQSRYLAMWTEYHGGRRKNITTVTQEALEAFNVAWGTLDRRLGVIPGKAALAKLRTRLQSSGINLTDSRIISTMHPDEVGEDLRTLIKQLDAFSTTKVE